MRKARVLKLNIGSSSWSELHYGVIINQSDWGAQIYDPDSPWGDVSPQMWSFVEWFPYQSRCIKIELL